MRTLSVLMTLALAVPVAQGCTTESSLKRPVGDHPRVDRKDVDDQAAKEIIDFFNDSLMFNR